MSASPPTSSFCNSASAVIQIHPAVCVGQIVVDDRRAAKIASYMILPKESGTIACPLNYFQEHASFREGWINDDSGHRTALNHVGGLTGVTVTVLRDGRESDCGLSDDLKRRLLGYFQMDMVHDDRHRSFDCYAFVSFLTNSAFTPKAPPFEYEDRRPSVGEIVALTKDAELPDSIRHWALCVGEDLFVSKFGKSGDGAQALVEITNEQAMLALYDCGHALVANRTRGGAPWNW